MAIKVVDVFHDGGKLVVTIQGDNPQEVTTPEARKTAANSAAACGYHNFGLNSTSGAYPVDKDGKTDDWNKMATANTIVGYRNDIVFIPRLR